MKILLISRPDFFDGEIDLIHQLFESGLEIFHLRKPGTEKLLIRNLLERINTKFHNRIMIHDHFSLLEEFALRGIHLTERHKQQAEKTWREIDSIRSTNKNFAISAAFHQLEPMIREEREYDYVLLSPIFDSISKKNYRASFEPKALRKGLATTKQRVVALGGCSPENMKTVKSYGFYGAAFLGTIWQSSDPVGSYSQIEKAIENQE